MKAPCPLACLFALATAVSVSAAERPWVEVKSPNFLVLSNAGEKPAQQIAWQLEQVHATFKKLWPWAGLRTGRPFVALAVRDESTLKSLLPAYVERKGATLPSGMFVSGADRHYVLMRTDVSRPDNLLVNPYLTVYQGYASLVLQNSLGYTLPLWLHRGLMQLLGNTIVRDKDVLVGSLIPWHFETLNQSGRLPLRSLIGTERAAYERLDQASERTFDAEAWALTHYMMFGRNGANQEKFDALLSMLSRKSDQEAALRECYGGLDALENEFVAYVGRGLYVYRKAPLDVEVKADKLAVRPLAPVEAQAAQAGFHIAMRRYVEARALAQAMRGASLGGPLADEIEGQVLDSEGKREEALAAYARAVENGSKSFYVHYRYASLAWQGRLEREALVKVRDSLRASVELNPDYPWAQAQLAEAQAELGEFEAALAAARKAVALAPGESYNRLSLARVLWRASHLEEARREAGIAFTLAESARDRRAAQELIEFLKGRQ